MEEKGIVAVCRLPPPLDMPPGVVWLAVTNRFGNQPLKTSQVCVSTQMCDGWMSNVCYRPLGSLIDWSIQHTSHISHIRGRFPKRLVMANHTAPGGMSLHQGWTAFTPNVTGRHDSIQSQRRDVYQVTFVARKTCCKIWHVVTGERVHKDLQYNTMQHFRLSWNIGTLR